MPDQFLKFNSEARPGVGVAAGRRFWTPTGLASAPAQNMALRLLVRLLARAAASEARTTDDLGVSGVIRKSR